MHAKCTLLLSWIVALLLLLPTTTLAEDYFEQSRTIAGPSQSTTERFSFTLNEDDAHPYIDLTIHMSQGRADLRILDPAGQVLQRLGAQECELNAQPIVGATASGTYILEVTTTGAVGRWHLRVFGGPAPSKRFLGPRLASAAGMLVVAIASVWYWRRRSGVHWRWFWVGALLWTVAVAVKFGIAIPLNGPLLSWLKSSLPYWAYLSVGTIYGGVMTGITEVLFTFVAALVWPRMAATAPRAVAIGVGAGAFEAALLAIVAAAATLIADAGATTFIAVLVPAIERLIAILCHVASRTLALMSVASRRWVLFWYGFVVLSGIDAVAMYLHLSGKLNTLPFWTAEAMIVPFALISIPITCWCIRHWPSTSQPSASATVVSEGGGGLNG